MKSEYLLLDHSCKQGKALATLARLVAITIASSLISLRLHAQTAPPFWEAKFNEISCFSVLRIDYPTDVESSDSWGVSAILTFAIPKPNSENPYSSFLNVDKQSPLVAVQLICRIDEKCDVSDTKITATLLNSEMKLDTSTDRDYPLFLAGGDSATEIWQSLDGGVSLLSFSLNGEDRISIPLTGRGYRSVDSMIKACAKVPSL